MISLGYPLIMMQSPAQRTVYGQPLSNKLAHNIIITVDCSFKT